VTVPFALTLTSLGFAGAFIAGMLGVGGAIVMVPLLLYVPSLLGLEGLEMKAVSGITMVQVLAAAASGVIAHHRMRAVHGELAGLGGLSMAAGTFAGALASHVLSDRALLLVFALMATAALLVLFVPVDTAGQPIFAEHVVISRPRAVAVCLIVGVAAGLVGAGGAFLLVPLLIVVVGVPIRVTIGSSLAITALAATAGVLGKAVTGQIPLQPALVVAAAALPGAQLGAAASRRLSGVTLKRALLVVIVLTGLKVWWDVLFG
jgi:uncharacterized membrane protein YfcA